MRVREVSGGGRAVEVAPERLGGWFERFDGRNGGVLRTRCDGGTVTVDAANGTTASVRVSFGELEPGERPGLSVQDLVEHLMRPRRIGLVLSRLGAHSVGVAEGGRVVVSRTDRHLVHGRNSAGGWSQQRFARRREGQARDAMRRAADDVYEVLVPLAGTLEAVVLGGDRRALDDLRADRRLAPIFALADGRVLELGEPRRTLLDDAAERARAVEVVIRDAS